MRPEKTGVLAVTIDFPATATPVNDKVKASHSQPDCR